MAILYKGGFFNNPLFEIFTHLLRYKGENQSGPEDLTGPAESKQAKKMGEYFITEERYNGYPVYKKLDDDQFLFVNNSQHWVVFHKIDPDKRSLRNTLAPSVPPPCDGWEFWNSDGSEWLPDAGLRVDGVTGLLVDIHGQAHGKNSTEIGYLYRKSELNNVNGEKFRKRKSSIQGLIKRKPNIPKLEVNKSFF